jgi:hypothetical protein
MLNTSGVLSVFVNQKRYWFIRCKERTARISRASTTRAQSWLVSLKAVHGIVLTMRPSLCTVVIGPYSPSAVEANRSIAYADHPSGQYLVGNQGIILTWCKECERSSILCAVPHRVLLCSGILSGVLILHCNCSFSKYSIRCPEA